MNLSMMTAGKASRYAAQASGQVRVWHGGLVFFLKTTTKTTELQRSEGFLLYCFTALLLDRHQNINILSPNSL